MIFRREMRAYFKRFLIWTLVIACGLFLTIAAYPWLGERFPALKDAVAKLPPSIANALSEPLSVQENALDYYCTLIVSVQLFAGAAFAMLIGACLLCKEEEDGTAEFLLSHPMARGTVVLKKFAVMWIYVLMFDALIVCGGFLYIWLRYGAMLNPSQMLIISLGILLPHVEMGALGLAVSAGCERRRNAVAISAVFGIALLVMGVLSRVDPNYKALIVLTPFSKMAISMLQQNSGRVYVAIAGGVTLVSIIWAMLKYTNKNIQLA